MTRRPTEAELSAMVEKLYTDPEHAEVMERFSRAVAGGEMLVKLMHEDGLPLVMAISVLCGIAGDLVCTLLPDDAQRLELLGAVVLKMHSTPGGNGIEVPPRDTWSPSPDFSIETEH